MTYPEEMWTWEKFDLFTLQNINTMIGDEFLDSDLKPEFIGLKTTYSLLKEIRKDCKFHLSVRTQGWPEQLIKDLP